MQTTIVSGIKSKFIDFFQQKNIQLKKPELSGITDIVAAMLVSQSVNTAELGNSLPKQYNHADHEQRRIKRHLERPMDFDVYSKFLDDFISTGKTIVLSMDQTCIGQHDVIMLSCEHENRAIPVLWKSFPKNTNPGFESYKNLLFKAHDYFSKSHPDTKVILMADRFYACYDLVNWLNQSTFDYRLRLKSNVDIIGVDNVDKISNLKNKHYYYQDDVEIFNLKTNLSWIFESGHDDGWAIISKTKSGKATALDYSQRWSIETMFSDFKSRGFDFQKTKIRKENRVDKTLFFIGLCLWFLSKAKKK